MRVQRDLSGHEGILGAAMREPLRLLLADEGGALGKCPHTDMSCGAVVTPTRAEGGLTGSWAETSKLRVTGAAHGDRLLRARSRVWRDSHLGVVGRE